MTDREWTAEEQKIGDYISKCVNRNSFTIIDMEKVLTLIKEAGYTRQPELTRETEEQIFRKGFELAQTTDRLHGIKHLLCHRCQGIIDGTVKVD